MACAGGVQARREAAAAAAERRRSEHPAQPPPKRQCLRELAEVVEALAAGDKEPEADAADLAERYKGMMQRAHQQAQACLAAVGEVSRRQENVSRALQLLLSIGSE